MIIYYTNQDGIGAVKIGYHDHGCNEFTDLGKLKLYMVVWFNAQANFHHCPQLPQKMMLGSKVVEIDLKILISLH